MYTTEEHLQESLENLNKASKNLYDPIAESTDEEKEAVAHQYKHVYRKVKERLSDTNDLFSV
jgi:ElaB/YqjD/DUF883 family membrane-anchored ribosome-binding protein